MYSIKKEKDKWEVVKKYEIGLSNLLKNEKVSISSFLDSSIKENETDNNNVPFFNVAQAIKCGFPFFKITVFKELVFCKLYIHDLKTIFNLIESTYDINLIVNHLNRIIENKEIITYLFPRFKIRTISIFSKKFINISCQYSVSGKFQIAFIFFNKLKITIDFPKNISYIDYKYKNFNFLLKEIDDK